MAIGLGALCKYQIDVTIVCVLAFAGHERAWRDPVHRLGMLLACLIALLLFAPHVAWLRTHDFGPIRNALNTPLGAHFGPTARIAASLHWLVDQVFNRALPALLLLALMELKARRRWRLIDLRRVVTAFVLIQALLLAISHLTSPRGPLAFHDRHWRTFDSSELARRIADSARQQLGGPVRIVQGEAALAGSLALTLPEHPLVLIDGRFDQSPWVSHRLLRECGAVQIGHRSQLPSGNAIDPAFPDLVWKVIQPETSAAACPR